ENIEEFGSELRGEAFFKFPGLCHRQVPVVKRQTSEHIAAKHAIASICRRKQNGAAGSVAAQGRKRSHSQWACGRCLGETIRIARSREVRNSTVAAVGVEQGLRSLEVRGVPEEIPLFTYAILGIDFTGSAEVGSCVVNTPRQPALHHQNGIERPAL